MYAQRKDVGAVGAKAFIYADNTIQHAGVVIGLGAHRSRRTYPLSRCQESTWVIWEDSVMHRM